MAEEGNETTIFTEHGSRADDLFLRWLSQQVREARKNGLSVSVMCVSVFGIKGKNSHLKALLAQLSAGVEVADSNPCMAISGNNELWIILCDISTDRLFSQTAALHARTVKYSHLIAETPTQVFTGVGFSPFSTDQGDDLVFQAALATLRAHNNRCESGTLRFHKQIDV